ncbi:MAG TPA: hypothetical protein VHW96_09595 [Solirubrobacteraceae bacterium]|nr:hypothetical protein [Solirubrobacteraceae bacterium]
MAPVAVAAPVTHAPPAHTADYVVTENAHSGAYFSATNTSADAGSIYQDVALSTSAGQTVCGSAWVRSQVPNTGASGVFALFLLGSTATDGGSGQFSGLSFGDGAWTQVHACVEATGSHTTLRIQLYPTPGGSTVEMDDVHVDVSMAGDGGFETGSGVWAVYPSTGTGYVIYGNSPGAPTAHGGSHFAAVNTAAGGGGIYQDVALNTSPGATVCASAWVRSEVPATGASGQLVVWLLGGSGANDAGSASFSGLPNANNWTQVHTCVEATSSHTTLRIQLYPTPGGPTVEIDDVNVTESLAANGGFETGTGPWAADPPTSTNYNVYANAPGGTTAHSSSHWGAVNTSSTGGSIYQDVALNTSPGQTVCGSAWVRTEAPATGGSGSFALFLLGSSADDGAGTNFSGLGNGASWTPVHTCVEATGSHTTLRIQLYPTPGGPTVELDDVDVTESLAANGGFETGGASWAVYPASGTNFAVDRNGQVSATIVTPPTPVQPTPQPTPIPLPKGKHALKIKLLIKWTWSHGTTTLRKDKIGRFPHTTRFTISCHGPRCPRPLTMRATGSKRIHALLKKLVGHRYHTGDVLTVTFTARGWKHERARITIRDAQLPRVSRA